MFNRRLEMLALGIGALNDAFNPDSDAFQLCNPSLARAYSFKHLDTTDEQGRRIFTSIRSGLQFLVQDLMYKCSGTTRARGADGKLKSSSTLRDLLISFRIVNGSTPEENLFTLLDFLTRALRDDSINSATILEYFISEAH